MRRSKTGSEPGFSSTLNNLMAMVVMAMSAITIVAIVASLLKVIPMELAIGQAAATTAVATGWRVWRQA